ncbi:hypothetical protein TI05_13460 [Achromatium sp. WMS3]|nr:hypothetical protein TI05_13460 [Achromatium sp. WMS3]
MQLAIELPDKLGQQLSQHQDIQAFVRLAIEKSLLEASKSQAKQNLLALMAAIPSSVSLANELIQERRLASKEENRDSIK